MDRQHGWDDRLARDAMVVLGDLVLWEMAPPRWANVARILDRLDSALTAGDPVALREAVTDLEIAGPVRLTLIGARPVTGVSQPILELRNTLVHRLTPDSPTAPTPEDDSADRQAR
jgi:hypothetical protein